MTTQEVANRLVSLCREGKYAEVYQELYHEDAWSIEPEGGAWGTAKGMEAMKKKSEKFEEMVEEVFSSEISDPIAAENFFSCTMKSKVKMRGMDEPVNLDEVCVYEVVDGKVVKEQFFYTPVQEPA